MYFAVSCLDNDWFPIGMIRRSPAAKIGRLRLVPIGFTSAAVVKESRCQGGSYASRPKPSPTRMPTDLHTNFMSSISIRRTHKLTHKQAVEVANQVAGELASEYGIETTWSGKTAHVRGSGLSGELHLAPKCFELDLKLGFVLAMFADRITAGIEAEFDKLLDAPAKLAKPKKK
jgi:putative polyhydroxyalkanoate system protein